ncbi:MAG TPA: YbaY family lipoprotein [Gemmatimonadaceae bacterium]|nr:YbaY family lipoprotein [Gemmatimonadaceae bacterium]
MTVMSCRVTMAAMMIGAVAAIVACAHPAGSSSSDGATLTGTVAYRERVALPPDAIVDVSITDATVQEVEARVVARSTVPSQGKQVPLPFSLHYDAGKLDKTHLYTVLARITSGGQTLFTTDQVRGVITQGNPTHVDLMLTRVDPEAAAATGDLAGSSWVLEDLNGDGVVEGTHVTLDFAEKGRATGSGSCNRYFATVDISGSSIRFGAVGATRMACATAISLQEVKYFEALEAAHRFTIEGGTLSIFGGGSKPLRFARAVR